MSAPAKTDAATAAAAAPVKETAAAAAAPAAAAAAGGEEKAEEPTTIADAGVVSKYKEAAKIAQVRTRAGAGAEK